MLLNWNVPKQERTVTGQTKFLRQCHIQQEIALVLVVDWSYVAPSVQHIICHPCASLFMSMSIFVFSSRFLKLFVLPQLPLSSLWFPWFLSSHNIHKKGIDGCLLLTPKNYFFFLVLINCSVNFFPGHCHFALPCSALWDFEESFGFNYHLASHK